MEKVIASTGEMVDIPSTAPPVSEEQSSAEQNTVVQSELSSETVTEEQSEIQTEIETEEETEIRSETDITAGNITISGNELKELLGITHTETSTAEQYDYTILEEKIDKIDVLLQMILAIMLFGTVVFICKYIYKFFKMFL